MKLQPLFVLAVVALIACNPDASTGDPCVPADGGSIDCTLAACATKPECASPTCGDGVVAGS